MNFFITGGSRGIGAGLVRDLTAAGHDVAFTYRANKDLADALVAEVTAAHPDRTCRAYDLDVRDSAGVEATVDRVLDDFDRIDAVVLNAAANKVELAVSMGDEDWREILDTNLTGAFFVCRQFLPSFLANRHGRFIHISSIAMNGMAGMTAYAASKAGLQGLSCSLAKEYGRKGITSNVLTLGTFDTDMTREQLPESQMDFWLRFCPVGRTGEISEVTQAVLYLASDGASFVNGDTISLTGGLTWAP